MRTTFGNRCWETRHRFALPLVVLLAGGACDSHHPLRSTADGSPGQDVALEAVMNVGDTAAVMPGFVVDAGPDLLPLCCSGAVLLRPVGPDAPCAFAVPGPPPPGNDLVLIYLNKVLVDRYDVDGGYAWSSGPTTSTVVFTGALCDEIMSSPQDSVVNMLCSCWEPMPPCPC